MAKSLFWMVLVLGLVAPAAGAADLDAAIADQAKAVGATDGDQVQLRALEAGMRIDAMVVDDVPLGVDTLSDLDKARRLLAGPAA